MAPAPSRNQPQYDFFTGAPVSPAAAVPRTAPREPLKESLRQSQIAKADSHNEDLRAQVNTLTYEIDSLKQERELERLRYTQEVRDAENKAEAEHRKAEELKRSSDSTSSKYTTLSRELQDIKTTSANEKIALEKKLRAVQDENQQLIEATEEAKEELSSVERQAKYKYNDLETRFNALSSSVNDLQEDATNKTNALQITQQRLAQKEEECGKLESEVLQLKAQSGGSEELAVVRSQLSEQVTHIKKLESTNRDQLTELKAYQKNYKAVEVVREEKLALENKLAAVGDLRRELGEVQMRRQALEDERDAWASYLESEASSHGDLQFESPEQLARAFVQERLETVALMDKLGKIQPELTIRDDTVKSLEEEKANLTAELEKLRNATGSTATAADNKARLRLERQRNLAVKEAEYLRAQLNAYGMEEDAEINDADTQKHRLQELETLVDQYRNELQTANTSLSELEKKHHQSQSPPPQDSLLTLSLSPKKRPFDAETDERLGELTRKNRALQDELSDLAKKKTHLETDLRAASKQITALKAPSRVRVLELRNNPTASVEAIKTSTLQHLQQENDALKGMLEGHVDELNSVPTASLLRAQDDIAALEAKLADSAKRTLRLKQIYSAKAAEFREAIASLLGFKTDFMPNGRVRVTSEYYPSSADPDRVEGENSIVFDGEKGEMKVSGGPKSKFASEIRDSIEYWVDERKEIPCFLAALTLEFYDRRQRVREEAAAKKG